MNYLERIVGKGLFASEGANFKRRRKTMNSIFNFNAITKMVDVMKREGDRCSVDTEVWK